MESSLTETKSKHVSEQNVQDELVKFLFESSLVTAGFMVEKPKNNGINAYIKIKKSLEYVQGSDTKQTTSILKPTNLAKSLLG